jgi:isoleucyl-tRNA synthetase
MYHIIEMMVRWLSPILSFTADEIWNCIPGKRSDSVFLEDWYSLKINEADAQQRKVVWDAIILVRDEINKKLETLRVDGEIGSSLDAEVDLYCSDEIKRQLGTLGDQLRFVLITSYARIYDISEKPLAAIESEMSGLYVQVLASKHNKCIRCWHHREDVGSDETHPELCVRCIENISND